MSTPTATLRKACRNCTKSKRKCSVQLPRCIRCTKKRLACSYDLEPLSTNLESEDLVEKQAPELCYLELASSLHTQRTYSAINIRIEWSHIHYVIWVLQQTPDLVQAGNVSALVHPKLHFRGNHNYLAHVAEMLEKPHNQHFSDLLAVDIDHVPLEDAITAIQALILYLIRFLFSTTPSIQEHAESHLWLLPHWAGKLWTSAWCRIPAGLSPWQAWLLGETTRRTIIMAYFVSCSFTGWKYGFCRHKLLFESLPFDGRVGLWKAESPQAWIATAGARIGSEVGTHLQSFHEFGGRVSKSFNLDDDTFLMLVQVAHNGKKRACSEVTLCSE